MQYLIERYNPIREESSIIAYQTEVSLTLTSEVWGAYMAKNKKILQNFMSQEIPGGIW